MADAQRDGRDARTNAGSPERPGRAPAEGVDRVPWRVEGARRSGGDTGPERPRLFGPRFWMVLLGLLVLNWVLSALLVRPPERTEVPYTLFRAQVEAGNVASVTGIEDAIDGQFKNPVRVPVDDQTQEVTRFSTRRPSFAADDNLWELLTEHNVEVSAEPPPGPSLLERVLLGFGPTLLLVGLFVLLARRAAGGAGGAGALGGFGRSRARRYEPETGRRTTFADVAGIDEVEDEVAEIVDFLKQPRPLPQARSDGPQGGAAGRAARDRQDPARPGRGRRGERALLLRVGLGVHRVHRRASGPAGSGTCSRRPRATPRRSSSSTSWTPSAGPAAGRSASAATTSGSRPSTRS